MRKEIRDGQPRVHYNCSKCPAICCSVYERVAVSKRDITRLAKHFGVSVQTAVRRYTQLNGEERVLRRGVDPIFGAACKFLDPETRGCTIYQARPDVCRAYPKRARCAYYDLLQFERRQQDNPNVVPLIQITFREDS
ncbi:MAG TPA: YkgJ family cysteine cluster protein [Abditibacteriaceae bacterium]|nr:YkgJ family cysteine cluster protein [Abditibacteriaceae bacterium]